MHGSRFLDLPGAVRRTALRKSSKHQLQTPPMRTTSPSALAFCFDLTFEVSSKYVSPAPCVSFSFQSRPVCSPILWMPSFFATSRVFFVLQLFSRAARALRSEHLAGRGRRMHAPNPPVQVHHATFGTAHFNLNRQGAPLDTLR